MPKDPERNRALNVRVDHLTREEQEKLSDAFRNDKRNIAPEARITVIEISPSKDSSQRINQLESEDE